MKKFYLLITSMMIFSSFEGCKNYQENNAKLLETDKYIIYTNKENIKRVFQKWLQSQKLNPSIIKEDTKLYNEIIKSEKKNPWNIYKTTDSLKQLNRLNFHTAYLLETNQAQIFNKKTHKIEKFTIEKSESNRKFKVSDTVILYIIDRFY